MLLKDKSEALAMNKIEAKDRLQEISNAYNLYIDWRQLPKETWDLVDDITNSVLWLEDRIHSIEVSDNIREAQLKCLKNN